MSMFDREECRLRLLEERDLAMVLGWRNNDRVRSNMFNDHIITMDEHLAWYSRLQQKNDVCLIFEWQSNPVGVMNFVGRDPKRHTCHWGFYLRPESLPGGMGTAMGYLGLEYAFDRLGVDCVIGEALTFNKASIRFHNRLGFRSGGTVKKSRGSGFYEDAVIFSLLKSDWLAIRSELERGIFASD
jgi:UDP-4-amino-4,6-dideoxy-N-acetyl-beta-L-altrosamine N-acetyltransferase